MTSKGHFEINWPLKNKEAELENTRKQLKEKSEGLSLKEAEFIDLEKVRIDI